MENENTKIEEEKATKLLSTLKNYNKVGKKGKILNLKGAKTYLNS